jgi:hypothetical protein
VNGIADAVKRAEQEAHEFLDSLEGQHWLEETAFEKAEELLQEMGTTTVMLKKQRIVDRRKRAVIRRFDHLKRKVQRVRDKKAHVLQEELNLCNEGTVFLLTHSYSLTHSLSHLLTHSYSLVFTHLLTHSYSLTHSPTHLLLLTHSLTHSLTLFLDVKSAVEGYMKTQIENRISELLLEIAKIPETKYLKELQRQCEDECAKIESEILDESSDSSAMSDETDPSSDDESPAANRLRNRLAKKRAREAELEKEKLKRINMEIPMDLHEVVIHKVKEKLAPLQLLRNPEWEKQIYKYSKRFHKRLKRVLTHSLTHSPNHLLTHSLTRLTTYSLTHLTTYSLTHSLVGR